MLEDVLVILVWLTWFTQTSILLWVNYERLRKEDDD